MPEDGADAAQPQPDILRAAARAARACSLIVLGMVVVSGLHFGYVLCQFAGRLSEMHRDIEIPVPTSVVLFPWICACVPLLVIGGLVAKEFLLKDKRHALIANGVVLVILESVKWAAICGMATIGEMKSIP